MYINIIIKYKNKHSLKYIQKMGRNKIEIDYIANSKQRKTTFKKRRLAVVKKAMELSKLSGCSITLQIYF